MTRKIKIVDTTLRDGEQTAGVVFANSEKIRIAKMLDAIGVDQIEVGIPVMGGDEKKAIKDIVDAGLNASIMGWNRAVISDIQHSIDCGCDAVAISISTSDIHIKNKLNSTREKVIEAMSKACEFAKKHNLYVSVNAEDASRTDPDYLIQFAEAAKNAGADRLRFCDTIGILDPFSVYDKIKWLIDTVGIDVELHMHNDFGLATANTLAGIRAGATWAGVTVVGLGERAGNAALEEVVMALKYLHNIDLNYDTKQFLDLARYVSLAAGRDLPSWKAIVGTNMFAHESGIHADGALKDPRTYEVITPEEVGLERQIVIGKHSGTASIKAKFAEYGIKLSEEDAQGILSEVRSMAVELKRPLFDKELVHIYEDYKKNIETMKNAGLA
ncbi:MAG: homocitrate synthase NifV [Clostridia bacterium]|nr:homocitrate synthase NifV [Clostridia bacterium]